jgi:cytochrome c
VPVQGGVFDWGDEIPYTVTVTDPEDPTIDCDRVSVNPGVFHDEGGNAHVHPGVSQTGCSGTIAAPAESGHAKSANIALVLNASYTDTGGAPGSSPLEGASTRRLTPKTIQAEHYTAHTGTQTNTVTEAEGGRTVGYCDEGEWIYFEPISLKGIDQVTIRYAAGFEGGMVDLRLDAPDGAVIGTATLPPTAGWQDFRSVTVPLDADDGTHRLYLTFKRIPGQRSTDLFDLDELTFVGKGIAANSAPTAAAQATPTAGAIPLAVNFTGTGTDADGDPLTYAWDFTTDGTVDATTANATHTYTTPGLHTATFTVSDGERSRSAAVQVNAYPPVAACPGDDEFSGTELNRTRWTTVVRENAQFMSVADGALKINAQKQDIHGGDQGLQNIVLQDLPSSGPWTATTRLTWSPSINYQNAGLMLYGNDANFIKTGMVWADGRKFEAFKETNNSPVGLGPAINAPAAVGGTFYMRLTSDGTNVRAQFSADGQTFTNIGNATNLNGLTNPKVGVYATASTAAAATPKEAAFDFFRLEAPQDPSDEFDTAALNQCRWSSIVRHEPGGYTVAGGTLTLPAAHGDFFAGAPNNNPNIILQPAPSGPWTATTRLTFDPNENYEQAGLLVYGDDANYVKADYVFANGRGLEFLREANNVAAGFGGFVNIASRPTTVDLRITSDGTTLRAYYRFDGGSWTPYGEPAALASVPNPKLGVYANDSNATVTSRNDAVFEYFRLAAGLPDTTAPTTTSSLAPAAPDGQNGWYRSNVVLTLATESGASTQYKVGNGAFQAYTGPVTLSQEGTTTVTYRSTDAEGNVEADKTVTVKIDKTVPTSTATPDGGTFTGPVQVTLAGADPSGGSGLDKVEYRLDGGAWTAYTGPVTISGNGPHVLEHRATDAAGNEGAVGTATFTINGAAPGAPTVQGFADPSSGPAPLKVHFSATALDPDGGPLDYEWELENGTVLDSEFEWTYTTPGVHTATVKVTDNEGDTATDVVEVTVTESGGGNQAPTVTAAVDKPSGAAPHAVQFTATGSDPDGPAGDLVYSWDFVDGAGGSRAQSPAHTYLTPGSYTATVTVTDAGGKTGTAQVAVTVTNPPGNLPPTVKAAAAPKSGNAPLDVLLTAQGSDPDGDALTYRWEFGDGETADGRRARHMYTSPGTYDAKVTARDPGGLTASATVQVVVGNPPGNQAPTVQVAADPNGGTAPLTVRFTAAARDPDGDAVMYVWSFGDGGSAGGTGVTHTYTTPGTYTAKVTVTDPDGATGSATVQVVVTGPAPQGGVKGSSAELVVPSSVRAFRARGMRLTVSCVTTGSGKATLSVTRATVKRLGLARRTVASKRVSCRAGKELTLRLKPTRAAARRLAKAKALKLTFALSVKGARPVERKVTIR